MLGADACKATRGTSMALAAEKMKNILLRIFGVAIGATGVGVLIGAVIVTVDGGISLVTSSSYLIVISVSSLALLMACAGSSLALLGNAGHSLVPRWALIAAGALMLIAVLLLCLLGARQGRYPNPAGILVLGALGLHWLRSGVRG